MIKEAIILAGGFGKRLQEVISDLPKPMAPILEVPFLNYQLNYLRFFGVKHVIISTGYLADKIENYYANAFNDLSISYAREVSPLGTGGGIRKAFEKCESKQAFVLNGDSFFDVDLNAFYNCHYMHECDFSIAIRRVDDASRYGTIELGNYSLPGYVKEKMSDFYKITSFKEKSGVNEPGFINGGIYILNKNRFFKYTKPAAQFSIETDFFEKQHQKIDIGAYISNTYFIDIGIPEDYSKAQNDFKTFKY